LLGFCRAHHVHSEQVFGFAYLAISNKEAASPSSTSTNVTTAAVVMLKFVDLGAVDVCVVFPTVVSAQTVWRTVANAAKKKKNRNVKMSIEIADEILDFEIN
jgi:hypothetical protein